MVPLANIFFFFFFAVLLPSPSKSIRWWLFQDALTSIILFPYLPLSSPCRLLKSECISMQWPGKCRDGLWWPFSLSVPFFLQLHELSLLGWCTKASQGDKGPVCHHASYKRIAHWVSRRLGHAGRSVMLIQNSGCTFHF